jgi:hypothetical protein
VTNREPGTNEEPGPAERLAELLETAPPEARREITAWLLRTREPARIGAPGPLFPHMREQSERLTNLLYGLAGNLPPTADSQVVTVRLPTNSHAGARLQHGGGGARAGRALPRGADRSASH